MPSVHWEPCIDGPYSPQRGNNQLKGIAMTAPINKGPRMTPCASCPYRRDVPSGVWDASEYESLRDYDGDIMEQTMKGGTPLFGCHQADGHLCAGWVGHRERPEDLLAIRLAVGAGLLDESVLDYKTTVPLFKSGQEAAEHGMADIDAPGEKAEEAVRKLLAHRNDLHIGPPERPQGKRQRLLDHIKGVHGRQPAETMRLAAMTEWHIEQHVKYDIEHSHDDL